MKLNKYIRILIGVAFAALFCFWVSGCSIFEPTQEKVFEVYAAELKRNLVYVENPPDLGTSEPITAAKGWRGDCSNYAAALAEKTDAVVWRGILLDGRSHAMACIEMTCADTIKPGVFKFDSSEWRAVWLLRPT
ncbi:MAG: hypothetical protein ACRBBW_03770 [Cellvibrionaceae bacterium]